MQESGAFLALISAALFGANVIPARVGLLRDQDVFTAVFVTILSGIPLFTIVALALGELRDLILLDWTALAVLSATGVINFGIGRSMSYTSTRLIGANRSTPLLSSFPLYSVMLGGLLLGEDLTPQILVAALLIFVGVILVSQSEAHRKSDPLNESALKRGVLHGLIGGVMFGVAPVLARVGVLTTHSPTLSVLISYLSAAILYFAFLGHQARRVKFKRVSKKGILAFSAAGLLVNLAQMIRFFALAEAPVGIVAPILATSPFFTLILSFLFIRRLEIFNIRIIFAALLIVAGVFLLV